MCAPALKGTNVLDAYRRVCSLSGEKFAEKVSEHEAIVQRKQSELAEDDPHHEVFSRELEMMRVMKTFEPEEIESLMQGISADPGGSRFLGKAYVYQQNLKRLLEKELDRKKEQQLRRHGELLSLMITYEECTLTLAIKPSSFLSAAS